MEIHHSKHHNAYTTTAAGTDDMEDNRKYFD
jgi:superoxide dismutase